MEAYLVRRLSSSFFWNASGAQNAVGGTGRCWLNKRLVC